MIRAEVRLLDCEEESLGAPTDGSVPVLLGPPTGANPGLPEMPVCPCLRRGAVSENHPRH